jgi:putative Mn2+ efflux pump MntP
LGFALAADAFAAALCQGAALKAPHTTHAAHKHAFAIAAAFGAAQAIAPLFGWVAGAAFVGLIAAYDHWIACVILCALGAKLLWEGLTPGPEDQPATTTASGWVLLGLAVATSIDAAAAGVTFPAMALPPLPAAATIGAITFALCFGGVHLGRRLGTQLGGKAEVFGGVALIGLGIKTLFDHGAITV